MLIASAGAVLTAMLGPALVIAARSRGLFGENEPARRLRAALAFWGIAGLVLWLTLSIGARAPATVGLVRPDVAALGWGILFGAVGMATFPLQMALAKAMSRMPAPPEALAALAEIPFIGRLFLLLTAGVIEEFLFRAVPIILLGELTGSLAIAICVPLLAFVLLHRSSWGAFHLIFVALAGTVLTVAFLVGGLWAAVSAHLLMDMPLMLAAPLIARRAQAGAAGTKHSSSESM